MSRYPSITHLQPRPALTRLYPWPRPRHGEFAASVNVPGVAFLTDVFGANARVAVQAAFGADLHIEPQLWNWYDITGDVRQADGQRVDITPVGRSDEFSTAQPAGCTFELANDTGDYTAYNPASKWWPYVRRNTPVRVLVNLTSMPSDTVVRFQGYATSWVPSWDTSTNLPVVTVAASGILRRLQQAKKPLKSPLYRAVTSSASTTPREYWTLDDDASAALVGSGVPGGRTMAITGTPTLSSVTGPDGDPSKFPEFVSSSTYLGNAAAASLNMAGATSWTVEGWLRATKTSVADAQAVVASWRTDSGSYGAQDWLVYVARIGSSEGVVLVVDHSPLAATSLSYSGSSVKIMDGKWHQFRVTATQNSGSVTVTFWVDGVQRDSDPNNATRPTIGNPKDMVLGDPGASITGTYPLSNTASLSLAHVQVYATSSATDHYQAGTGYTGETATARIGRLCTEEGVLAAITGVSTTTMGPQSVDTFVNLLRECETADHGALYDGLGAGVGYVARTTLYNAVAALTVDASAGQVGVPFEPADDDQRNRNLVKADRKNGSQAIVEQVTGPLGTAAVEVYDGSTTVNIDRDADLVDHAGWLVRQGTVEGFRYPKLNLDLAATPAVAAAWLLASTRPLNRLDVTNLQAVAGEHPAGDVQLFVEGWGESLCPFAWLVGGNCSPFAPWQVGVIEGAGANPPLRWDSTTSTVATDATSVDTSLSVASTELWTTTATFPADLPFDADLGTGERVTVTAVSGAASPQTFTVTRAVNGVAKPVPAGTTVKLWHPAVLAL